MTPILYIMARSDLASLNPGKLAAQVCHAGTVFERHIKNHSAVVADPDVTVSLYNEWRDSTVQGFGTVIVLDAIDEAGINDILYDAARNGFEIGGVIHDPTYPIRDGEVTHYIPLNTVGYIFADSDEWKPNRKYRLYA